MITKRQCSFTGRDIELDRRNERNLLAWKRRRDRYYSSGGRALHINTVDKPMSLRQAGAI